jgi:uncharacterized protein YfaQ (DUF2300 family)
VIPLLGALALAAASAAPAASDDLVLAWLRDGRVETRGATAPIVTERAPLGSLWKLWVYGYALEAGVATPPYRCGASRRPGEEYCCEPGQSVERDQALARSCGLFFEPGRLGIDPVAWREFWSRRAGPHAAWLSDLGRLRPETTVPIAEILHALAAVPPLARASASRALLPVVIDGYGSGTATRLGGLMRVKTFTWSHPARPGASLGGGGGWLVDGTPVWFSARGSSRSVLHKEAAQIAEWLPAPLGPSPDDPCVEVAYFARYPIRSVDVLPTHVPAAPGILHGRYRVAFENDSVLTFESHGDLRLELRAGRPQLHGRLTESEYVARVLDREGDGGAGEAARALAVAARTWLVQNAAFENGCYQVEDSTRAQRVSASPASSGAVQAALFTDGLLLKGAVARYRLDGNEPGALAWKTAVQQARAGLRFDEILASAFPTSSLAATTGEEECRPLPEVQAYLSHATLLWGRRLAGEPGFEPPDGTLSVCAIDHGAPYVDTRRLRVYLRGLAGREDRLTLAHEYVHLAFRFHPTGTDEDYVERLARSLMEE